MTKTVSTSKKPRKQHSPEFRSEALKLAERIGVLPQPVNSACMNHSSTTGAVNSNISRRSSERELEMPTGVARLKRQLAERDEELAILQKAATYFAKHLK